MSKMGQHFIDLIEEGKVIEDHNGELIMNKKLMKKVSLMKMAIYIGAVLLLPGCVSPIMNATVNEEKVKTKTAKYFDTSPSNITITDYSNALIAISYRTRFAGKLYNCTLNYGAVDCKVPGSWFYCIWTLSTLLMLWLEMSNATALLEIKRGF